MSITRRQLALLATLTLMWGCNWPMMKFSLREIEPLTFRALTMTGGVLLLAAWFGVQGVALGLPRAQWRGVATLALPNIVGWHLASIIGLTQLPAGRAGILAFTMPVWTVLLAGLFLHERITYPRLVALALGLAGVLVILRPGLGFAQPAALAMLLGSLAYAASLILTKRLTTSDAPLAVLFWMSVIQLPLGLAASLPQWVTPSAADLPWIVAVGIGSYTAHYCLTRALKIADASVVVGIDFVRLPLIALLGALLYNEALDPMVFVGAAIIFAGTYYSVSRER